MWEYVILYLSNFLNKYIELILLVEQNKLFEDISVGLINQRKKPLRIIENENNEICLNLHI